MKKILLASAFVFSGFALLSAQEIELSESIVDFGQLDNGSKIETTIQIKNTGDKPLIIESAKAGCGCTVPVWPKAPIAPGKSADLTVKYSKTTIPGKFTQAVTITSNAVTEGRKVFRIKGDIATKANTVSAATK